MQPQENQTQTVQQPETTPPTTSLQSTPLQGNQFVNSEPTGNKLSSLMSGNIVKKYAMFKQLMGMVSGAILFFIGIFIGLIIAFSNIEAAAIIFGIISGFGTLIFVMSFIGRRQLKQSLTNQPTYNTFQNTDVAVEYKAPDVASSIPTIAQTNETIGSWLGPVTRGGLSGVDYTYASKEIDNQAENTLLFTSTQVIGIMITPQDVTNLEQSTTRSILNEITNYAPDTAYDKNMDFEMFNLKHWSEIITSLQSQPLASVLQSHFNFNIPYSNIETVQVHDSAINRGLIFHLKDGKKISYRTIKKDQLPVAVEYLKNYLTIS